MTDMQTSLPLLIVRPSILNPVINFSTHLWPVKWNALCYTFALRIPFHFISSNVDATHAPTISQMIWSTSYHHVIVLVHRSWPHLPFTVASVHRCQVLLKLHRHTRSLASKPQTCPSHLQPPIKPSLVLIFSTLVTWLSMQWAPSSYVWALQQVQAIFTVMAWVAHTSVPVD